MCCLAFVSCDSKLKGHAGPPESQDLACVSQVEFKKWCPAFKLLTYYGSAKERKAKRQGWSKPNAFHIAITSYTLILQVCLVSA